jgi:hypothetical protein
MQGPDDSPIVDGVQEFRLSHWREFHDYVHGDSLLSDYVWRGQGDADWSLVTSLHRLLSDVTDIDMESAAKDHLAAFRQAVRGRRGPNPPKIQDENQLWALGQHVGLATPLLDWTESPYVALFFAFANPAPPASGNRVVWQLFAGDDTMSGGTDAGAERRWPSLEILRPDQDENPRLVSQRGLFARVPLGESVDAWVRRNLAGESTDVYLAKIVIPDHDRDDCLRHLNRMNINHLSLFPDLIGASNCCNQALLIENY